MIDDFKIKLIKTKLKKYNIIDIKKITKEGAKKFKSGLKFDAIVTLNYKNRVGFLVLSNEEFNLTDKDFVEYVENRLSDTLKHMDKMEYLQNNKSDTHELAAAIAAFIYVDGAWQGLDRANDSWFKFAKIQEEIEVNYLQNKNSVEIFKEMIKTANCKWA